jgi:hypothetical protein
MGRGGTDLLWSSGITCTSIVVERVDGEPVHPTQVGTLNLEEVVLFGVVFVSTTAELLQPWTTKVIGTSRTGN